MKILTSFVAVAQMLIQWIAYGIDSSMLLTVLSLTSAGLEVPALSYIVSVLLWESICWHNLWNRENMSPCKRNPAKRQVRAPACPFQKLESEAKAWFCCTLSASFSAFCRHILAAHWVWVLVLLVQKQLYSEETTYLQYSIAEKSKLYCKKITGQTTKRLKYGRTNLQHYRF